MPVDGHVRPNRQLVTALKALLWTALYVLGIWYSHVFVVGQEPVTLFWPAAGAAFAAVVGYGPRWALIIPLGVLVAQLAFAPMQPVFAALSVLSSAGGALAGAAVLRFVQRHSAQRTISVVAVLDGAVTMALAGAAIGVAGLLYVKMVGFAGAPSVFVTWALGDLLGIVSIAPALLLLMNRIRVQKDAPPPSDYAGRVEKAAWLLCNLAAYLFLYWVGSQESSYVLGMVAFPLALLVWSAFRFSRLWTALATMAVVFVVSSITGLGLSSFRTPSSMLDTMLLLAFLNLFAILPMMLVELIHGQRTAARRSLRLLAEAGQAQQAQLEAIVAERTRQLDEANRQLLEISQTDALTGLRNRRYAAHQLPLDIAFYAREAASPGARPQALYFALVDIDHFKRINDTLGHHAGDRVLQQFGAVLAALVRSGDYAIRWGGEEFLLVLRPMASESVATIGERIRSRIAAHRFELAAHAPLPVTCSIGFSELALAGTGQEPHWEQWVELADAALYWVKRNGRDNWAMLQPAPGVALESLLERLRDGAEAAIAEGTALVLAGERKR